MRLRQAYQQALQAAVTDRSRLPLDFSFEEGDPPVERLHFRIWDRRSFTLAHDYTKGPVTCAQTGSAAYSQKRNTFFLEFVKAERLTDAAPPEGLWFIDLLKMDLIGQKLALGAKLAERVAWLEAWGVFRRRENEGVISLLDTRSRVTRTGSFRLAVHVYGTTKSKGGHCSSGVVVCWRYLWALSGRYIYDDRDEGQ